MMSTQLKFAARVASAILLLSAMLFAQKQPTTSSDPNNDAPPAGVIRGTVVSDTGQPLIGATVYVREMNALSGNRTSPTDSDGNFRVNNLAAAVYFVSASFPAYVTPPYDPMDPSNFHRVGESVRLELVRGGVITGTVTNAAGEPVISVRVRAQMVRDSRGQDPPPFSFREQSTDDRGIYRIFGLMPGTYVVCAGGGSSQGFQLNPYSLDVPTYSPSSNRDTAAEVNVRGGEEANADIRYRGEQGRTISGTVKLASANAATLTLTQAGTRGMPAGATFQYPGTPGFSFMGIGDGEYEVTAQEVSTSQTNLFPDLSISDPKRVTVKGADVTGIELTTKPLARVSGRIALEPSKTPECQNKRPPLFVETVVVLQPPEKEMREIFPNLRMIGASSTVDEKGGFLMRNVVPGKYVIEPRFYARYWYLDSINTGAAQKTDMAGNWTTIKFGDQLTTVTISLAEGAASIRGRLMAEAGAEVPSGLVVYLMPADREKALDVLRFFVASVDADGTFAFNNLPPGRYFTLTKPLDAQTATLKKLRMPEAAEARAKLRRVAETQKSTLELKPCQNLTDYKLTAKP
jgi:carboxypeptidase family protein